MDRAADGHAGGGRHRALGGLPRRPLGGVGRIRAELEHQAAHRAPEPYCPGWAASLTVLRRVRDALASGGRP
jgi:hypothetical protein